MHKTMIGDVAFMSEDYGREVKNVNWVHEWK